MVKLELSKEDAETLAKALDFYVSELRMEISNTDRKKMRDELKSEEALLKSIVESLRAGS